METKYAAVHPLLPMAVRHLTSYEAALTETFRHIDRYGMEGGIAGFIYTDDCRAFLAREGVLHMARMTVRDYADGIGEPLMQVAARIAAASGMTDLTQEDEMNGARMLLLPLSELEPMEMTHLAWFAMQRVAYAVADAWDDGELEGTPLDRKQPEDDCDSYSDGRGDFEKEATSE